MKDVEAKAAEELRTKLLSGDQKDREAIALLLNHIWKYPDRLKKWADQGKEDD